MNATKKSLPATTSLPSIERIIVHSNSIATIDVSAEDVVNMIELDDTCDNCTKSDSAMELTPYPYNPTSEEMTDFYQLEQSFGEDWSFRLASELSSSEVTMGDTNDCESIGDSVTFFSDDYHQPQQNVTPSLLPEDIEIRTYTRRDIYYDVTETPSVSFGKFECL